VEQPISFCPPAVTTIAKGAVNDRPSGPSSDNVTLQSLRPDLSAAGVKDSNPSSEMAAAWENRVAGEELQAMLNEMFSKSPTPAEMPEAQILL
jgi:hypothetical protein